MRFKFKVNKNEENLSLDKDQTKNTKNFKETIEMANAWIDEKIGRKTQNIHPFIKILPEFTQLLTIHMQNGCSIETALKHIFEVHDKDSEYTELIKRFSHQSDGAILINQWAQEVNHPDFWRLSRLINQYKQTGSSSALQSLDAFHSELWNNKLTDQKIKFEKIGVSLTFLTMLSFISVIIIAVAPIIYIL